MSVREAYGAWAGSYDTDRNLTRDLDEQVTREALGGRRYASVLELGCGTGKNTGFLAGIADRLLALDFSAAMLARARRKIKAESVRFALADLTAPWPCAAQRADLVVGNLVLEHIADLTFIFAQAYRVLKPGGTLYLSELHPFRQYQGKKARFEGAGGTVEIPAFVHHVSDFLNGAAGFTLQRLGEWWHPEDTTPRLLTLRFARA